MTPHDRNQDRDHSDTSPGDDNPPVERRELDLSAEPLDFEMDDSGTANPDDIRDPEIREAVAEAQEKVAAQEQQRQQQPTDDAPPDDDTDEGQMETGAAAELPNLADEPMEYDEFFEDELGDPERAQKEAYAAGLDYTPNVNLEDGDAADAAAAEQIRAPSNDPDNDSGPIRPTEVATRNTDRDSETDTDTETSMSDRNPTDDDDNRERAPNTQSDDDIRAEQQSRIEQGRDQPQGDADVEQGTEEHVPHANPPADDDRRDGPPAPEQSQRGTDRQQTDQTPRERTPNTRGQSDTPGQETQQRGAQRPQGDSRQGAETPRAGGDTNGDGDTDDPHRPTPGAGANADVERVEQISEDDMREAGMDPAPNPGGDAGMPDPADIDFDAQDIEGASEDAGDQMVEFNERYFLLSDLDDARAEQLLNDIQTSAMPEQGEEGQPGDQFYTIIDSVVTKPSNAAERTRNWKYLHRATLAGRCMEHCGLDDIVDFQSAPGDTPGQPQAR